MSHYLPKSVICFRNGIDRKNLLGDLVAGITAGIPTLLAGLGTLAIILGLRRFVPRAPGAMIAIICASLGVWLCHLNVATIGSKFGGIDDALNHARGLLGLPLKLKPASAKPEMARERWQASESEAGKDTEAA